MEGIPTKNDLYSIDSMLVDLYNEMIDLDFKSNIETDDLLNEICSLYESTKPPPLVIDTGKKHWWEKFFKTKSVEENCFKIVAISTYHGNREFLRFNTGDIFYVVSSNATSYDVARERSLPFSITKSIGKVPRSLFNKAG